MHYIMLLKSDQPSALLQRLEHAAGLEQPDAFWSPVRSA